MSNFDLNAILRGAQLTIVGGIRALQNPGLFKAEHYRQAVIAVVAGIVIRLVVGAPIICLRIALWMLSFIVDFEAATWDDSVISGIEFFERSVLQIPFFLMSLMRYITPTLDELFMTSLDWVDRTYVIKHKTDDPTSLRAMYYPNLKMYSTRGASSKQKKSPEQAIFRFLQRFGRRAGISLAVYALSFLPVVGRFVLPAVSFYTFNKAVGPVPAAIVFGSGLFLPKKYLVVFLQHYFSSRSLMRELLEPYFSRIKYTPEQKRRWFRDREGLLFGFGVGFYTFLKIPLLGVLIYGIAEASTAYLITKITDPPPPPSENDGFAETQVKWRNKIHFLSMPLMNLDAHNISANSSDQNPFISNAGDAKKLT